ncbi:hypothetical protein HPP92_016176 [Vanilla planifolia]|uniref:Uncharacterized protein n=1 Tax=Vanilla planifolia TaxID=51239 RepID=A0A835QJJ2_VANPL|nr:hypothetical protein HPP92_016777 [Vanilla planifolia]KAG0471630.1 hypothetical protein HPP92_016176 [Vanilla planifolia]
MEAAQEELKRANLERDRALEELVVLKRAKEEAALCQDKMKILELEAEKAKDSERKMLESLVSQTKQLEQTKILFEEAKLEIRNLQDGQGNAKALASLNSRHFDKNVALTSSIEYLEEIRKLKSELRSAIDAEEKSNKAMDDLAIALKEVTAEVTECKEELSGTKSELERARAEAEQSNSSLQSTERKLKSSFGRA